MNRRDWAIDGAVAGGVLVVGQLEVWAGMGATHRQGPPWAQALTYAAGGILLLWRRRSPLAVLAAIVVAYAVDFLTVGAPEGLGVELPTLVAAYSVARWERRYPPWWGLALVLFYSVAWILFDPLDVTDRQRLTALFWASQLLVGSLVGALVRSRLQTSEQRRLRRSEQEQRAVAEERNRIARELHDVIGHSVSVMTVQAAAVRRRLTPEQQAEREALLSVEAVGREALREMRRMVGVLRERGETVGRQPPPTLSEVDALVGKFRAAGLPVEMTVSGEPRQLAPGLDLTAYRLVQEGLTNVLRHASAPGHAQVRITYTDEELHLVVRDDGAPVQGVRAGDGLLGLRERVGVYGGRLDAGPLPDRGFELRAVLPVVAA